MNSTKLAELLRDFINNEVEGVECNQIGIDPITYKPSLQLLDYSRGRPLGGGSISIKYNDNIETENFEKAEVVSKQLNNLKERIAVESKKLKVHEDNLLEMSEELTKLLKEYQKYCEK